MERTGKYRMARRVLMADVSLDGWREGRLGRERNDGGGLATMHER